MFFSAKRTQGNYRENTGNLILIEVWQPCYYHQHCSVLFLFQRKYFKVLSECYATIFQGFNAVCKVLYWLTRSNRFLGGSVLKFKSAVVSF